MAVAPVGLLAEEPALHPVPHDAFAHIQSDAAPSAVSLESQLRMIQPLVVKLYGAGRGQVLESYQTGILISADGEILTAWSTVLDIDVIRVVTSEGSRYEGRLLASDPLTELAIVKIDVDGLPFFKIDPTVRVEPGDRVFAISNLFGIAVGNEPASVQRGSVMSIGPLQVNRGRPKTPFRGDVIYHDCMTNNPGAKGGALVNLRGELIGLLGKEWRDENFGIWINYAVPNTVLADSVQRMRSGATAMPAEIIAVKNPHTSQGVGFVLLPDVLARTPAFVDQVLKDSLAARSGIEANDLILFIQNQRIGSHRDVEEALSRIDRSDSFDMIVQRGSELITIEVRP